jgi:hypothetical protein
MKGSSYKQRLTRYGRHLPLALFKLACGNDDAV